MTDANSVCALVNSISLVMLDINLVIHQIFLNTIMFDRTNELTHGMDG